MLSLLIELQLHRTQWRCDISRDDVAARCQGMSILPLKIIPESELLTTEIMCSMSLDIQGGLFCLSSTPSTTPKISNSSYPVTSKGQVIVSDIPSLLYPNPVLWFVSGLSKETIDRRTCSGGRLCPSFRKTWSCASYLWSGSDQRNHSLAGRFVRRYAFDRFLRSGSHNCYWVRCFSRGGCCGYIKVRGLLIHKVPFRISCRKDCLRRTMLTPLKGLY